MERAITLMLLISCLCLNSCFVSARSHSLSTNSTIITTLQFKGGDIVDCYDINKQPTLNHPLLKNHKVQRKPNLPSGTTKLVFGNFTRVAERKKCPPGSVPIPRTAQHDRSVSETMFNTDIAYVGHYFPGHHRAFLNLDKPAYPRYKGAGALVNAFQVPVTPTQSSGAFVMLHNGPPAEINLLAIGWMSSERVFGTSTFPRLYIYWTADGYKTSCYNSGCQGFMQVDREIYPSIPLNPPSTPGNPHTFHLFVYKDNATGNWWLVTSLHAADNVHVGYWPKEVFPYLEDGANMVAWGGLTIAGGDGKSPPMGSGHFPRGNYNDDSIFLQLTYVDEQFKEKIPEKVNVHGGAAGCYGLKNDGYTKYGYSFTYGGPGGNCGT